MPPLLSCQGLSFAYRGRQTLALDQVDFDLEEGELGPQRLNQTLRQGR